MYYSVCVAKRLDPQGKRLGMNLGCPIYSQQLLI